MRSVLFVFHGNICRSAMPKYIFRYLTYNKVLVDSRVTSIEEIGNDIYPNAKLSINDIEDPWYTRDFDKRFNKIYEACLSLKEEILN